MKSNDDLTNGGNARYYNKRIELFNSNISKKDRPKTSIKNVKPP